MSPPADPTDSGAALANEWGAALAEQGAMPDADTGGMAAEWASMMDTPAETDTNEAGADRLLNQEEIDGLLGFTVPEVLSGNGTGIRAIADTGRVSHERFSDNVEVTLDGITSVRFGDYLNSIPLPALLSVVRAEGWDNLALVTVESSLTYAALDMLLGGRRATSGARLDGRAFTTIETQLIRRLVEVTLAEAETAFRPISPVRFAVDRIETNPRFAVITRPANAAILIDLRMDMEGRGGNLQIILPYATIEPIRDLLLQSFMGEKLGRDAVWEGHLATEIWQADIAVEAVLHETRMPLKKMLSLEVGDTLTFDVGPDAPVILRLGDVVLSQGRIGRIDDQVAIQVMRPLIRSRTTLAALESGATGRRE
jgi:flagellar motor switch protein FliM